jgi:hypothetical protein
MTTEEMVVRIDAKLASIDRQHGRSVVTFLVRDDEQLERLERSVGAECMLGVLVDQPPVTQT